MSEIERAIEYFEQKIIKNDRACENYVAPFAEEAKRQWVEIDRPIGETALTVLRAALGREANEPPKCCECKNEADSWECERCIWGDKTDRYEPKEKPTCTQD